MTEDEFSFLAERAWQAAIANAAMAGESVTEDDDAMGNAMRAGSLRQPLNFSKK